MFVFTSEDDEDGLSRKKRYELELIRHAYNHCNTMIEVADYCGFTVRTLRNRIKQYSELSDIVSIRSTKRIPYKNFHREDLWKSKNSSK